MRKFLIKFYNIISYKMERKRKVRNSDFKCYVTERKDRVIHPLWFIFLIISIIYWVFVIWIIDTYKSIPKSFCIF